MAEVIPFPDPGFRESDRLNALLANAAIDEQAASLGTPEDWAWSAVSYLKCALTGTQGGTLGGSVVVSAAAIGLLIGEVERLAMIVGVIDVPGGAA